MFALLLLQQQQLQQQQLQQPQQLQQLQQLRRSSRSSHSSSQSVLFLLLEPILLLQADLLGLLQTTAAQLALMLTAARAA